MFDSFDRNIHYLRISVTDKCNLRCIYCMPEEGVEMKKHAELLSFEQIVEVVKTARTLGFDKVRLTGGEPLVRRGIVDLVGMLRKVDGIKIIAMTTNGHLLPELAAPLRSAGLDSLNVSLDTLDPVVYERLTRGGRLAAAIEGIDAARKAGFTDIKINMVLDEGGVSGASDMAEFCRERGLTLQRIRRYSLTEAKIDGGSFERPPHCGDCNRLRLTCDGTLKPCLHSNREIPVDFRNIAESIIDAVGAKPSRGGVCTDRNMMSIGG